MLMSKNVNNDVSKDSPIGRVLFLRFYGPRRGRVLFLLFYMDRDEVEVHKNAKRERGQICNIKVTYQCKILIVPEEGWFGQPKYSTPTKKSFYVVSTSASIFFILYVKPIRSLLIQRTPAGSSFRLFA